MTNCFFNLFLWINKKDLMGSVASLGQARFNKIDCKALCPY